MRIRRGPKSSSSRGVNQPGPSWATPVPCGGYGHTFPVAPHHYFNHGQNFPPPFACGPSNNFNQGQSSGSGRNRKKIYSILAEVAVNVLVGSVTGLPIFYPSGG